MSSSTTRTTRHYVVEFLNPLGTWVEYTDVGETFENNAQYLAEEIARQHGYETRVVRVSRIIQEIRTPC